MPLYKQGNMWGSLKEPRNETFIVTTNNIVKRDGSLVMGAGVAKQATLRFPGVAYMMGYKVKNLDSDYHFFVLDEIEEWNNLYSQHIVVGALQTKRHYKDPSDIRLVENSIKKLNEYANSVNSIINCPLPGTGLGGLKAEIVKKITEKGPNNIVYWTY